MNEVKFVEIDASSIENKMINDFENAIGETLYPGDERRIFLLQEVPVIVGLKNDINYTGNQNLLPFAVDKALDGLGSLVGVTRLAAQKSLVTIKFTLSEAQVNNVIVPAGTRVTPDGVLYFETTSSLIISSGNLSGTILAKAMEGGSRYNGFIPGQIKTIVDQVPYVSSAANIDTSYNGSDVEDDDSLRSRIQLAPESFSTAGPEGAYIYWAKTADVNIADVSITSPSPGTVNIYILMKNGVIPTQDILNKAYAEVSPKSRRPLTDYVQVLAPNIETYDINLTYYIDAARKTEEASIISEIENEGGAVDQYIAWQSGSLGRDINLDYLKSLMFSKGAFRIVSTSPNFVELTADKVAILGTKTITYGGLI